MYLPFLNPFALRKTKIAYNFGLYECNRVKKNSHRIICCTNSLFAHGIRYLCFLIMIFHNILIHFLNRWQPFKRSAYLRSEAERRKAQPEDKKFFEALIKPKVDLGNFHNGCKIFGQECLCRLCRPWSDQGLHSLPFCQPYLTYL